MIVYYQKRAVDSSSISRTLSTPGDLIVVSSPGNLFQLLVVRVSEIQIIDSVVINRVFTVASRDSILLRHDPVNGRAGNVRALKWFTTVFKRPEVKAFFEEAVKICTYKESRWDAKVVADLYSLSPIPPVEGVHDHPSSSYTFKRFIDYFGDAMRAEYDEMISKGMNPATVFRYIKKNNAQAFSKAFRLFKKENPGKTIYDAQ